MEQRYCDIDRDSKSYLEVKSCNKGIIFAVHDNVGRLPVTLDLMSTGMLASQLIRFAINLLEKKSDREFFRGFNI